MLTLILLLTLGLDLALASELWGVDSTDSIDSPEWERRRAWAQRQLR